MKSIINDQVEYDSTRKSLKHRDTTIILSASTARLLELFIAHKNQQLHREFIIEEVWKKHGMAPSGHSLNKSISILRKAFSELGADNPIETLPRQGFLFHASVNDEQSSFSGDVPVRSVTETVNSPATPKRKNIVLFILLFAFLGSSVLILPALNSGATNFIYIRAIGDCELYTADDNNADKTKAFLSSDMWRKINATCHDGKKTIVFMMIIIYRQVMILKRIFWGSVRWIKEGLPVNAKIIFISGAIFLAVITAYFFYRHQEPETLTCSAKNYLHLEAQTQGVKIEGEVLLVFRISSATEGRVSQIGSLNIQGKHYAVDRNVVLNFIGKDRDGYLQTRRLAIVKNKNDNVPDDITELLMSQQDIFYYKVIRIAGNVYAIRDLRRTLMVCRAA
nr:winged helix-turn-helix domain-containing protein [Citrobacter freundii]